jgi:predicted metal-dependent peptidase
MTPFQKARARMLLRHPFFASILMSTPMIEKPDSWFRENAGQPGTACTDMKSIWYCKEYVEKLSLDEVICLLAEETLHITLMHGLRRQHREPRLWNAACDYVINCWLKKMGFALDDICLYNARFEGFSAERVYDFLHRAREEFRKKHKGKDPGGDGDVTWEPGSKGTGMDLMEPKDIGDPAAVRKMEQDIRQKIAVAAQVAKMAGKSSSDLDRLLGEVLESKVPWQDILREWAMAHANTDEESWSRRDPRVRCAIMPSLEEGVSMGEIIIIPDTSGSMGDKELAQIGGEITEMWTTLKPERIRVVWADSEVKHEEVFEQGEQLNLHPKGGGGTDMRVPLKYVERYNPVFVIMITDAYTPWPSEGPPFPVVLCNTTEQSVPEWAMEIKVCD